MNELNFEQWFALVAIAIALVTLVVAPVRYYLTQKRKERREQ